MRKKFTTAPLVLVMGALAFAQQPKALKEIPLYPGAARDEAAMDEERAGIKNSAWREKWRSLSNAERSEQ